MIKGLRAQCAPRVLLDGRLQLLIAIEPIHAAHRDEPPHALLLRHVARAARVHDGDRHHVPKVRAFHTAS